MTPTTKISIDDLTAKAEAFEKDAMKALRQKLAQVQTGGDWAANPGQAPAMPGQNPFATGQNPAMPGQNPFAATGQNPAMPFDPFAPGNIPAMQLRYGDVYPTPADTGTSTSNLEARLQAMENTLKAMQAELQAVREMVQSFCTTFGDHISNTTREQQIDAVVGAVVADHPNLKNALAIQEKGVLTFGDWKVTETITESLSGKSRSTYNVVYKNGNETPVFPNLAVKESAIGIAAWLDKGHNKDSRNIRALLNEDERYDKHANDFYTASRQYSTYKDSNPAKAEIFENAKEESRYQARQVKAYIRRLCTDATQ